MSKYIDADHLKEDIQANLAAISFNDDYQKGYEACGMSVLKSIDSLQQEQQEVDLKKEIDDELDRNWRGYYIEYRRFAESAKHFYELGLNARKEE